MSARFFASVRKNQRQWMVVVTVLSMVSFLFLDDFGRGKGPMSAFGGALMIGCLCAAGMCIVGYPRQKTAEFGIGGFLVGFIVGFIGFGAVGQNKPIVRTASGSFNRNDFDQMAIRRTKVNQFVHAVARKTENSTLAGGFGGNDDATLIMHRMLLADAKRMGIQVSDDAVNSYLKKLTQERLSKQDLRDCLRDARLGEGELFEFLKEELSAQLVESLTVPPAFVAEAPPGFAQYVREPLRYMQQTPFQLWDAFQMLNLKQSLEAVAIPVKDFVSSVSDPSDSELAAFFDKYKNNQWVDEARPGFLQMPRVQLAYLTGDFEKFELGINVTDEDVREYYEKNKDRYRAPVAKESTAPKLPDTDANPAEADALKPEGTPQSQEPAAADPSNSDSEKKPGPATVPGDKKPAEGDKKPDPVPEKNDDAKNEPAAADQPASTPKPESKCGGDEPVAEAPAKDAAAKVEADKTEAADPSKDETKPAAPTESAKTDDKPTPANPDSKTEAGKETEVSPKQSGAALPSLSTSPEALPEPKFRELNDELKLEIREAILRERAFAKIASALDQAYEAMRPLGMEYDTTTEAAQKTEQAKLIADKMKDYAQKHDLQYKETSELTYEELVAEPIGMGFEGQGRSSVTNEVFMRGERNEPRIPLYSPRRADLRNNRGAFAYWKINDSPAKLTDLKDEAVREKVILAWKFDQARQLAEKRAEVLAKKAKDGGGELVAAISGESSTGATTDPQLSKIETPEFTWLTTQQSVPSARQEPMISDIPLIAAPGNDFMKKVFEDLGEGEIGVAANDPRSVFYVVKVLGREAAKDDGGVYKQEQQKKFLAERFTGFFPIMKSPYESLAQFPQRQIDQGWRREFEKRHNVEWEEKTPVAQTRRRR